MPDASGYAARLNAFKIGLEGPATLAAMVSRAAEVDGLSHVDLNFPDHLTEMDGKTAGDIIADHGIGLNGFAMRYYSDPAFKLGALTHPDPAVRQKAVDLTKAGLDALQAAGGHQMVLWLGQDGFDYPFQADHDRLWALEIEGLRAVADHAPGVEIAIEYKPNEPRAFSLLSNLGTTLLAIKEAANANLGVTLDFAHVLYANENPAQAAALTHRTSRLMGVHLNDGYGKRDDGLMVGAVNLVQTLEFLATLDRIGYDGVLYFDTFPDIIGLNPVKECAANIAAVRRLQAVVRDLAGSNALADAMAAQDAIAGHHLVQSALMQRD
ncbi:MAG: sugar phosphate isomerase/epimerase family protein [Pseudomonadota bacterium]